MTMTTAPLTSTDQYVIARARAVAAARTAEEIRDALAGHAFDGVDNLDTLTYAALGQAGSDMRYLCDLAEKLAARITELENAGA